MDTCKRDPPEQRSEPPGAGADHGGGIGIDQEGDTRFPRALYLFDKTSDGWRIPDGQQARQKTADTRAVSGVLLREWVTKGRREERVAVRGRALWHQQDGPGQLLLPQLLDLTVVGAPWSLRTRAPS
jgi:hypothetical protein